MAKNEVETTLEETDSINEPRVENLKDRLSSTKFIAMNYFAVLWVALLVMGTLTESGFVNLMNVTIGGFFLSNAASKFSRK